MSDTLVSPRAVVGALIAELVARAETLLAHRELAGAITAFDRAERAGANPDHCAGSRWWCYMLQGNYEQAWRESDAIRARGTHDPHRVWNGQPIPASARVLVRSVHGFGDAVQMLRFAPRLRASHLAVQCAPALCELLRCLPGVDAAVPWGVEPLFDAQLEINELAHCVRATVADVAREGAYLHVAPLDLPAPAGKRVGLVWTGGDWSPSRSIALAQLEPLIEVAQAAHVELWSLQSAENNAAWREHAARAGCPCLIAGEHSVMELAHAIAAMDLVITVDTFAAHLAGAMGKPCWVLLEAEADWRWMIDREDSPWYPSLRLFRQREQGCWGKVVERVATELRSLA